MRRIKYRATLLFLVFSLSLSYLSYKIMFISFDDNLHYEALTLKQPDSMKT